jgi:hypothetical protein
VFTRARFKLLSRSNFHNQVLWLLVLNFTGSPIHPPLGALSINTKRHCISIHQNIIIHVIIRVCLRRPGRQNLCSNQSSVPHKANIISLFPITPFQPAPKHRPSQDPQQHLLGARLALRPRLRRSIPPGLRVIQDNEVLHIFFVHHLQRQHNNISKQCTPKTPLTKPTTYLH